MIYHKHAHKQAAPQASPHTRTSSNRSSPPRTVMQTIKAIMFLERFVQLTHPSLQIIPKLFPHHRKKSDGTKDATAHARCSHTHVKGLGPSSSGEFRPPMIKRRVRRQDSQGRRQPPLLKICGCSGPVSSCGCSGPALAWRWTRWTFICPSWASMMKNA